MGQTISYFFPGSAITSETLLKETLRVESASPVKLFTFIVDDKVKETPIKDSTFRFEHSDLWYNTPRLEDELPVVVRSSIELDSHSIVSVGGHSFIQSAILAYNKHMHLVVRPDDVWLAVVTQFSLFVRGNASEKLWVSTGGTLHTAPYEELALMMTDQIAANIKDPSVRDWVFPNFSTTSNTDRVVSAFALMTPCKKFFSYFASVSSTSACGLPKVTILGSEDDWRQIRQRVEQLIAFYPKRNDMRMWVDMLLPVMDHFVLSAEGNPDTKWWNQIASYVDGGSGPIWVSGWITVFMVFSSEGEWIGDRKKIRWPSTHMTDWTFVHTNEIPLGPCVPCRVKIDDNGKEYDSEIYAGHIVAKLINNNTIIVPQLDWCILVRDQKAS